ncbi:MAG: hypothetical protein ACYDHH_13065 [Solirubrobacteraceae bacterium]
MSKRSRQRTRGRASAAGQRQLHAALSSISGSSDPPVEPERLLLDQIASGELDAHLAAIADAVDARHALLETVSSAKALAMLNVGDRVRFNHHTRPQYLRGAEAIVVELDQRTATVRLQNPVGRFKGGEIRRCPPLLLDRLHPAA